MRISITNTKGLLLNEAKVTIETSEKSKKIALSYDSTSGSFIYLGKELKPNKYNLIVSCEGYEPEQLLLNVSNSNAFHKTVTLGKLGCRFLRIGKERIPIETPVEKLHLIHKELDVKTISERKTKQKDSLKYEKLSKWILPNEAQEKNIKQEKNTFNKFDFSEPPSLIIPKTKTEKKELKAAITESHYEVSGLTINTDEKQPYTILGDVLFLFKANVSNKRILEILEKNNFILEGDIRQTLDKHSKVKAYYKELLSWDYIDALNALQDYPEIEWALPNHLIHAEHTQVNPSDEMVPSQWSLFLAKVPEAWLLLYEKDPSLTYGNANVIVDVFDSGIQSNVGINAPFSNAIHPDLNVNIQGSTLRGIDGQLIANNHKIYNLFDFAARNPQNTATIAMLPNNDIQNSSHGTCVAGIIGAGASPDPTYALAGIVANQGVTGVAPNVRLMGSKWVGNMPNNQWYQAWLYLAGLNPSWTVASYIGGQVFPNLFNTPLNTGPGFSLSNHSHSWPAAPSFANGTIETDMINAIVSFGRNRKGAFILFASGNNDQNISAANTRIAQHEKIVIVAGSSIGPKGIEERTSYSNFGSVVAAGGFNGPAEYAEIDFCAPTNHHSAWGTNVVNAWHYSHNPGIDLGIFSTELVARVGVVDSVGLGGVAAGSFTLNVTNGALFRAGDPILIGNIGGTREFANVGSVVGNVLNLTNVRFSGGWLGLNNGFLAGARVEISSNANTPYSNTAATTLNLAIPFVAGAPTNTLIVNNAAPFAVGMAIGIGNKPIYPAVNNFETGYIETIVGNTITLRDPLRFGHLINEPVFGGLANLTDSFGGTSAACPFASGVLALVLSANPHLSFWEARDLLKRNATPVDLRLQSPAAGLNVAWVDIAGNNLVDANGLLTIAGVSYSITSVSTLNNPRRSEIRLSPAIAGGLAKGQAIIIGAESTVVNFTSTTQIQLASSANFRVNDVIEINSGPLTHLAFQVAVGANNLYIGNINGFRVNHRIQIGAEIHRISALNTLPAAGFGGTETLILTLATNLANAYPINTQITLANFVNNRTITAKNDGTNTITITPAIVLANYPTGGINPPIVIRKVNTELAVIQSINSATDTITVDPLVFPHVANEVVIGGLIPHYSYALGSGRLDAYASVNEALNYNHDARDLMIRNYMLDDGKAATNLAENPIDSPDIWMINQAAVVGNVAHGAANTPANAQTTGSTLHQKPRRSFANVDIYTRIYNRGNNPLVNSFDYSVHIYLALKDVDMPNPILVDDYIDGPTTATPYSYFPFGVTDALSGASATFNLNNTGVGVHPGTSLVANFNSSPANYGGTNTFLPLIAGGNGLMYIGNLANAQRPRLPYSFVVTRITTAVAIGALTVQMEHTRGFANGQQVIIGYPGANAYELASITGNPTINSITLSVGTVRAHALGTFVIRLDAIQTTLSVQTAAALPTEKVSILNVTSANGFKVGNYIVSGSLTAAPPLANGFHRIVRVIKNTAPATNQLVIEPPLTAIMPINTPIQQIGGQLKTFVLSEVTPHDGILAGNKPEENNNISYKEIKFEHEVLFKDTTGNLDLPKRIQVANAGGILTTNFRIYVKDADNFKPEDTTITVTRKLTNGNFETETYFYKTTAPIGWTMLPAAPAWLVLNAPLITSTNAAAPVAVNQTDIYFTGSFNVDNTIEEIQITVNVLGNDTHPLGARDFITAETFVGKVFVVNNLPNVNDANLQDQTGMPALAGTQMLHAFADMTSLEQTPALSFGPKSDTVFRLTSSFTTNSNPAAIVNAFAVIDGIVFIQRNVANNTINLVIKPLKQSEIGFSRVKYFIYRGLKEEDFFTVALPDRVIVNAAPNPNAHFVDSIIATQNLLNPGQPVKLTALGWDPTTQALNDSLDDFFFNSNPNNQLPVVKRGMSLGRFKNQEFGFEIVLAEGAYPITIASLQQNSYSIDVSAITNADEKAAKREEILNYIDPAAYYGMHYLSGILYPVLPDPSPANIDTILKSKVDLYTLVVSKFATKNTLYIDVRNENGYSYNYYGNYTQTSGSDLGKAIRIGFIPPAQQALTTSRYVTQEWPIMLYDNASLPENNPENMSAAYLQLSTADNGNPIAFFEYGNAVTATTQNNYAETTNLLETLDITNITVTLVLSTITVTGDASALNSGDIFHIISCDHLPTNAVYKVLNKVGNVITVENGTMVHNIASGPVLGKIHFQKWTKVIAISHPNHPTTTNPNQKLNVAHVLKLRYFRQNHETGKSIIAIDQANKKFVVAGLIPRLLKVGDKLIVCNATTTNNGTYTIAANGVLQIGSDTHITVTEAIPAALSVVVGANNGMVKIKPTLVPATVHYTDHKFGSLNGITRLFKIIAINPISAVQATITIAGDYRHILSRNLRISIINATTAINNGSYAVTSGSVILSGVNTTVTITTTASLSAVINLGSTTSDFISVLAMPWRSDLPTQWISGFDFRYLDAKKQLTDATGAPKDGFAYMGQTGVAIEQNRIIFQMTPLNFFAVPSVAYSPNIINMNGGTSSMQSFWKLMQTQNQNLVLNATMLKINPGPIIVPVFDFVDDTADAIADDPIKSNFLSLCITQIEFQRLKDISDTQLNALHDLYIVLRKEKNLTDVNGVNYKTFELAVSGFSKKADNSLVANEVYPTVPIVVYALREDSVVFTSKDFADVENTETVRASFEETKRVNTVPLNVYALNPTIQTHINTFNTDLIALNHEYTAITALVQARAQSLWAMATTAADAPGLKPYDDRQLYWARLHARNAIREHATLRLQFGRRKQLMQLFEEYSRGFRSISYTAAPVGAVKILVVGFDPFDITNNEQRSNPSGSIALYLDGKVLTKGAKQGYVQSIIFPVRYGDFDAGLVERMIKPYMSGIDKVDMIVTCSMDIVNYFNIDRFASKFRDPDSTDNESKKGNIPKYYKILNDGRIVKTSKNGLPEFIETTLPFDNMNDTVGNTRPLNSTNQIAVFNQTWVGRLPNGSTTRNVFSWDPDTLTYNPANAEVPPAVNVRATEGSGGTYLSNEIFYRVSLMRTTVLNSVAKTGHLHVPQIQNDAPDDFNQANTTALVQNARTIITDALSSF